MEKKRIPKGKFLRTYIIKIKKNAQDIATRRHSREGNVMHFLIDVTCASAIYYVIRYAFLTTLQHCSTVISSVTLPTNAIITVITFGFGLVGAITVMQSFGLGPAICGRLAIDRTPVLSKPTDKWQTGMIYLRTEAA